ncbi:MAG: HAMP domain-containing histidine kinase [Anaerolineae bacterium]|nr:HAMP domain-containing histidine kinase [Anaerolineae bacterium]
MRKYRRDEPWERKEPQDSKESWECRGPWEGKEPWKWEGPWGHHERHEHWGPPPWEYWRHHHRDFRKWRKEMRRKRGGLFFRFVGAFGCLTMLIVGGMAALAFLLSRLFEGSGKMAVTLWLGSCGLALALALLAGLLGRRTFRDIATPLADVMTAADAVAEGDLSVRVEEDKPGEFGQLARSFNRMVGELERSDQQRRNLTADVAHELRTPLHIIQGNLEGVLDDVYEPTDEHIQATLEETQQLSRLVEDLRTLSLAEAGQLPLVWEPVDVSELLTDVRTSFSGQAEAADLDLRVEAGGDLPTITGDVGRLDQVLGNLIANAIRHTPPGGSVMLEAEAIQDGVRIRVRDIGEGIPADDLPHIFDRFWKGDRSRTRAGGAGSGLGLAIARQLVQVHGGTICVESEIGQGTTFIVDLPSGEEQASRR